jgi:hypothetical protein
MELSAGRMSSHGMVVTSSPSGSAGAPHLRGAVDSLKDRTSDQQHQINDIRLHVARVEEEAVSSEKLPFATLSYPRSTPSEPLPTTNSTTTAHI